MSDVVRPRLLDLYAGAGGSARGYQLAGFHVTGIDVKPQPNYCGDAFEQADALGWDGWLSAPHDFDAIHASPPCQAFTSMQSVARNGDAHDDLIGPTRELLQASGLPYVIENVPGAPLIDPFQLCGSSFGLGVPSLARELRRHRMFETNWPQFLVYECAHQKPACGIYGDHFRMGRRSSLGEFSGPQALAYGSEAMGIDWMTQAELSQAIPPLYTEHIGHQLMAHLQAPAEDGGSHRSEMETSDAN